MELVWPLVKDGAHSVRLCSFELCDQSHTHFRLWGLSTLSFFGAESGLRTCADTG